VLSLSIIGAQNIPSPRSPASCVLSLALKESCPCHYRALLFSHFSSMGHRVGHNTIKAQSIPCIKLMIWLGILHM